MTALAVLALWIPLAACAGAGTAQPVLSPPGPRHIATLGDSITAASYTPNGYPVVMGKTLGAEVTNLGIGGMTAIPYPGHTVNGVQTIAPIAGVLVTEVPKIPLDTDIVTLYIGTNDIWVMTLDFAPDESNMKTVEARYAAMFAADLNAIVAGIRQRVPKARLVIATVPNRDDRSVSWPSRDPARQVVTDFSDAIKADVVATGATVVDLLCEPAMYDETNFPDVYNVHPNDLGQAAIARDFVRAIQNPAVPGTCSYETVLNS